MIDDIVTRLRIESASSVDVIRRLDMKCLCCPCCEESCLYCETVGEMAEAADEIERLRNMLAHGLVFGSTCEGCLICEELKEFHEQTLREIALENQTNG